MSDIFSAVIALHEALQLAPLNKIGLWQTALPGGWWLAVNGSGGPLTAGPPDGMPCTVARFHAAFWYNGWLAGDIDPVNGGVVAAGSEANVETLVASLLAAAEAAKKGRTYENPGS